MKYQDKERIEKLRNLAQRPGTKEEGRVAQKMLEQELQKPRKVSAFFDYNQPDVDWGAYQSDPYYSAEMQHRRRQKEAERERKAAQKNREYQEQIRRDTNTRTQAARDAKSRALFEWQQNSDRIHQQKQFDYDYWNAPKAKVKQVPGDSPEIIPVILFLILTIYILMRF